MLEVRHIKAADQLQLRTDHLNNIHTPLIWAVITVNPVDATEKEFKTCEADLKFKTTLVLKRKEKVY